MPELACEQLRLARLHGRLRENGLRADRVIVLHNGRLVADGEPREVIQSAIVREAYLGVEQA